MNLKSVIQTLLDEADAYERDGDRFGALAANVKILLQVCNANERRIDLLQDEIRDLKHRFGCE